MSHLDKLELMSFLADDISNVRSKAIAAHIQQCAFCKNNLEDLKNKQNHFLSTYPEVPGQIHNTLDLNMKKNRTKIYAIAAMLLLFITTISFFSNNSRNFRIKGSESIRVFCKRSTGVSELSQGSKCHPGDLLQFSYSSSRNTYFFLGSIDSTGKVYTFYPENSDSPVLISAGADIPLPNSIQLDSYLGPELYIAAFNQNPFEISSFVRYLENEYQKTKSLEKISTNPGKEFLIRKFLVIKE